ncbi:Flavin-dependent oxidoreductase, luciferase family (includes alkanesulfonate monooxygenase SsuD and methylene tetrahydromethanopterin reductase) [Ruegeria halocynthiae]|uniref:Flavin-dependent oxidoreductase, luciferase family (Includes alkanesulfonate monooxygenase SsuD and methylene tetrahydromethanopterin reductase) n=1 Tax=Ruegeria halocynthiae TaxID=985054 RepID=A0A1H3E963_9RHOB|nr:LLM class flavin-dependent oxidoreductase [Ruegeria halocynthiae]SDX74429.1 Flavin-dependent oxidoreductase, luciferase family (includes alkanesulfonate monooxygenase SsuD and methylene tetrahydromethanopterin reductase) [Ruegeria halocynthiae]
MRFSLFVHMERTSPDQDQQELYENFIALAKIADEGGMYAVWTGEHHGMDFTISPNPFLNLIDLARQTRNVRLGTGTVIAPFWHPIRLAGEAAMTDMITNGRLDLGIARGAYSYEYERMVPGLDAWEAGQRMREIVPALRGLWEGDYALDGEFHSFPATTSSPKPLQQNGPPIWVAARDPNSHEFAVSNGCHVQVTPLWQGDEEITRLMDTFNAACAKFPDVPRPEIMLLNHTYIASDEADARRAAEEINRFYCYFGAWFKNERPVSQGLIQTLSDDDIANHPFYSPEAMIRDNVIGTPDRAIERIKGYRDLGYDEYSLWIDSGMSFERKKASLERFIADVMPAFA